MAPRGRPRKPRLSRMDAAVDAMAQMGFDEEYVRKTVDRLLNQVYGGDDWWGFIEADAYKVLIDALLDEEEANSLKHGSPEDDGIEDAAANGDAGPSGEAAKPASPVAEIPTPQVDTAVVGSEEDRRGNNLGRSSNHEEVPPRQRRKHKPCYGWISSGEEDTDDDDFILLTPAPRLTPSTPGGEEPRLNKHNKNQKRRRHKSRWDIMPD